MQRLISHRANKQNRYSLAHVCKLTEALRLTEDSTFSLIIVLTSVMSVVRKTLCEFHSYAKTCVILLEKKSVYYHFQYIDMKIVVTTPLYKRVNNLVKNHYITTR